MVRPTHMKASVTVGDGTVTLKSDLPVPKPGAGQILVRVVAAAQNPTECEFHLVCLNFDFTDNMDPRDDNESIPIHEPNRRGRFRRNHGGDWT
jgi:hypothetical protein